MKSAGVKLQVYMAALLIISTKSQITAVVINTTNHNRWSDVVWQVCHGQ